MNISDINFSSSKMILTTIFGIYKRLITILLNISDSKCPEIHVIDIFTNTIPPVFLHNKILAYIHTAPWVSNHSKIDLFERRDRQYQNLFERWEQSNYLFLFKHTYPYSEYQVYTKIINVYKMGLNFQHHQAFNRSTTKHSSYSQNLIH